MILNLCLILVYSFYAVLLYISRKFIGRIKIFTSIHSEITPVVIPHVMKVQGVGVKTPRIFKL
jgi:hypothetical protein